MTAQRIDQLRRIELLACDVIAAYSALLDCIEHPASWKDFDVRVRRLNEQLAALRAEIESEIDVAAPVPLRERREVRQLEIIPESDK
jgi:hypothetical protein